jgi:hypothetical protein
MTQQSRGDSRNYIATNPGYRSLFVETRANHQRIGVVIRMMAIRIKP